MNPVDNYRYLLALVDEECERIRRESRAVASGVVGTTEAIWESADNRSARILSAGKFLRGCVAAWAREKYKGHENEVELLKFWIAE